MDSLIKTIKISAAEPEIVFFLLNAVFSPVTRQCIIICHWPISKLRHTSTLQKSISLITFAPRVSISNNTALCDAVTHIGHIQFATEQTKYTIQYISCDKT